MHNASPQQSIAGAGAHHHNSTCDTPTSDPLSRALATLTHTLPRARVLSLSLGIRYAKRHQGMLTLGAVAVRRAPAPTRARRDPAAAPTRGHRHHLTRQAEAARTRTHNTRARPGPRVRARVLARHIAAGCELPPPSPLIDRYLASASSALRRRHIRPTNMTAAGAAKGGRWEWCGPAPPRPTRGASTLSSPSWARSWSCSSPTA